jgi:hypothetical protein
MSLDCGKTDTKCTSLGRGRGVPGVAGNASWAASISRRWRVQAVSRSLSVRGLSPRQDCRDLRAMPWVLLRALWRRLLIALGPPTACCSCSRYARLDWTPVPYTRAHHIHTCTCCSEKSARMAWRAESCSGLRVRRWLLAGRPVRADPRFELVVPPIMADLCHAERPT